MLFTTLAPSGAIALALMGLPILSRRTDDVMRARLNLFICIPLVVTMVGLVASATHLGNPANALYVFLGVGRSPLSNEVFCAVAFLASSGLYWLYSFAEHPKPWLQRTWLVLVMAAAPVFVMSVGLAYTVETIVSWYSVYVPINLVLNAFVGGPLLAVATLHVAGYFDAVLSRHSEGESNCTAQLAGDMVESASTAALASRLCLARWFVIVATVALAGNLVGYSLQAVDLSVLANSVVTASELVPHYGAMIVAFGILCVAGVGFDAVALWGRCALTLPRAFVAVALVFMGIFVMRFAFYMMHMTVGLGV